MNELALFAGAGGGILGGHLLGWRTVCAVEWEPYPASVLCARQNDGLLPPFPIWDDVQTFRGEPWRGIVDVVSGGFPCQDISAAGGGAGINGERSGMWREMARIIYEVRPKFVFVENSPMLTSRGLGTVLGDLASMGFDARWGVLGAADVGANHQRDRIWIKATNVSNPSEIRRQWECSIQTEGCSGGINGQNNAKNAEEPTQMGGISDMADADGAGLGTGWRKGLHSKRETGFITAPSNTTVAQPECKRLEGQRSQPGEQKVSESWDAGSLADATELFSNGCNIDRPRPKVSKPGNGDGAYGSSNDWWQAEPNVGRVAHGVAARVDRLKAIGNGQVPLCAATAWRLLA